MLLCLLFNVAAEGQRVFARFGAAPGESGAEIEITQPDAARRLGSSRGPGSSRGGHRRHRSGRTQLGRFLEEIASLYHRVSSYQGCGSRVKASSVAQTSPESRASSVTDARSARVLLRATLALLRDDPAP